METRTMFLLGPSDLPDMAGWWFNDYEFVEVTREVGGHLYALSTGEVAFKEQVRAEPERACRRLRSMGPWWRVAEEGECDDEV